MSNMGKKIIPHVDAHVLQGINPPNTRLDGLTVGLVEGTLYPDTYFTSDGKSREQWI